MSGPEVKAGWLTREQIQQVIEGLSAADLIAHMVEGQTPKDSARFAGEAFDAAAARLGISNGTGPATEHVRIADFRYMVEAIGQAVNIDSPLSDGLKVSPPSATTGA